MRPVLGDRDLVVELVNILHKELLDAAPWAARAMAVAVMLRVIRVLFSISN